jgi:hypothetical protein
VVLGPPVEGGDEMLLGLSLRCIRLPVLSRRRRRHPRVTATVSGRGERTQGCAADIGSMEEAIEKGRLPEWLTARSLRDRAERERAAKTGSDDSPD